MTKEVQFRRGSTPDHVDGPGFTGALAEVTVDTTNDTLRVHDGSTKGGHELVGVAATQTLTNKTLQNPIISGVSTISNGTILIGTASSTGTESQPLQVNGGTYVSGSVGIGTTNPRVVLDTILNQDASTTIQVQNDADGTSANASVLARNNLGFFSFQLNSSARTATRFGSSIGGFAEIYTGSTFAGSGIKIGTINALPVIIGTNNTEALRIDSSQRVGIGTTNPTAKLEPVDTAANPTVAPVVFIQRPNNIPPASIAPTNADLRIKSHSSNVKIYAEDHSANPLMILTGSGNLGIGITNPLGRLQVGAAGTSVFIVDSTGGVGIGTTSTVIGIGNSFYDGTKLHVVNTIDNASTEGAYSVVIDTYMNGTQTPPATDAEQAGLLVNTRSDVTSGTTANEHQAYGIYNVLRVNGDSDAVYPAINNGVLNHTSGTVTNYFGFYNLAESTATSDITSYYGTYSVAQPLSGSSGTISDLVGIRARTNFASGSTATATDIFAVWASIDNDAATTQSVSGICALYYGSYDVTTGLTNPYGVYIPTNVKNYFSGSVGIGSTLPTAKLDIAAGGSAASSAPIKVAFASTVMATPEAGAIEYDGTLFYATPNSSFGRAAIPTTLYASGTGTAGITLNTNFPIFPAANDTITLPVGTYLVRMRVRAAVAGSTVSSAFNINLRGGGTAVGSFRWGGTGSILDAGAASSFIVAATALGTNITVTAASAANPRQYIALGEGILKVTTGGTIIPSYQYAATLTSGTTTLVPDNYMIIQSLDSKAVQPAGPQGSGWG